MIDLPECHAFIACSLDGYIARLDGSIDWLTNLPTPFDEDFGYAAFIARRDAILMGRGTFDKVAGFDPWPYSLPVTVLSRTLKLSQSPARQTQVSHVGLRETLQAMHAAGRRQVYVDGGQVISGCLGQGLLTQLTLTRVPVVLGTGLPLFHGVSERVMQVQTVKHWPNGFVQTCFVM